ncbi:uncharacterized protein LOC133193657 [Saccostrea echinata]|uniref:uncharacterized protein LOC133193657 n=1 Tax=Saccostrea echinata TaxID=191078 RepID=UPI002A7EE8B0|nr:uncharacterized protein LOC133193657 [Saccostrea echinata]
MFVRVSFLFLISLVLFAALETALTDDKNFKKPDARAIQDDTNFKKPEARSIPDDANFKKPEARSIPDDVNFKKPEARAIQDDAHFKKLEARTIQDDVNFKNPEARTIQDDANFKKPEARTIQDDVNFKKPEARTIQDDVNFKKPEAQTIQDDVNFKKPEARTIHHFKKRCWRKGPRKVAFTAYLGDQKIHLAKQVIRYSRVTYNLGRGYRNGIFRAPSTGVYVFYFTSMPQRGKGDALWLVKNRRMVVESVSGRVSSAYNMGSNMAILYLKRGSKVWVQTSPKWTSKKTYRYKYSANSFSGFRLY